MKSNKKKVFIIGISGQDGSYLCHLLIKKGYDVIGFTRNKKKNFNLKKIGVFNKIKLFEYRDANSINKKILKLKPFQIYNLSGQSSVSKSFNYPLETYESNIVLLFEILEFCRLYKIKSSIYNACSTDCFGNFKKKKFNEEKSFHPLSPYARSKSFAFWIVKYYRETFNLNCCSGILSNHESPLRAKNFLFHKIIKYVKNFNGKSKLSLGNINIKREWGWAPDYVNAIYKICKNKKKNDYLVSTGQSHSIKSIIKKVFKYRNISTKYLKTNCKKFLRPQEIKVVKCNVSKIDKELNWKSNINIDKMLHKLINDEYF